MRRFVFKIILFCVPLIVVLLYPSILLFSSGESFKTIDELIKSNKDYLIGYLYDEDNYNYLKQAELENRSPQIVALGSSRVLQFRDSMFTQSFYNAGYTIVSISDFAPFIRSNLKNKKTKLLLIGLDQWMFNENWDDLDDYPKLRHPRQFSFISTPSPKTLFNVWSDVFTRKYSTEVISTQTHNTAIKIGLNAIVNHTGFRKDGSLYYGRQIEKLLSHDSTAHDFEYMDTYTRIKEGNRRFQYSDKVHEKALLVLKDLLLLCKKMDIYVVAILPPFANGVNKKMIASKNYTYLEDIHSRSSEIFKQYSFELWDMSNLTKYNSNDNEVLDGFHGSEVTYLKMLIYMIEKGSILKEFTELNTLQNDLKNKTSAYSVYPNV